MPGWKLPQVLHLHGHRTDNEGLLWKHKVKNKPWLIQANVVYHCICNGWLYSHTWTERGEQQDWISIRTPFVKVYLLQWYCIQLVLVVWFCSGQDSSHLPMQPRTERGEQQDKPTKQPYANTPNTTDAIWMVIDGKCWLNNYIYGGSITPKSASEHATSTMPKGLIRNIGKGRQSKGPIKYPFSTSFVNRLSTRAVVKSTFVESKTRPSPKRFESESSPSPKRFESKSKSKSKSKWDGQNRERKKSSSKPHI